MDKDKNVDGWEFNPWIDEYDPEYDSDKDEQLKNTQRVKEMHEEEMKRYQEELRKYNEDLEQYNKDMQEYLENTEVSIIEEDEDRILWIKYKKELEDGTYELVYDDGANDYGDNVATMAKVVKRVPKVQEKIVIEEDEDRILWMKYEKELKDGTYQIEMIDDGANDYGDNLVTMARIVKPAQEYKKPNKPVKPEQPMPEQPMIAPQKEEQEREQPKPEPKKPEQPMIAPQKEEQEREQPKPEPKKPEQPMTVPRKEEQEREKPRLDENLPVISGLQIYRRVMNEIGKIKGTKAIGFHDFMQQVAIIGRPIAWITEKVTGRKKEMKRIIESMEGIDFEEEFGITSQQALDLMLEDCLIKGTQKGELNPRNITKLKVNDIFLRALEKKLRKDLPKRVESINDVIEKTAEEMKKLEAERISATPERKEQIDALLGQINIVNESARADSEKLNDQILVLEDGRKKKSLEKKENITGTTAAVRNPENREQINELANIEKQKLIAERDGKIAEASIYAQRMTSYMDSQTLYKKSFIGKSKVSIGNFESPSSEPKIISNKDYLFTKIATGIGAASIFAAASLKRQLELITEDLQTNQPDIQQLQQDLQRAQKDVDSQTRGFNALNQEVRNAQTLPNGAVDTATQAVKKPAIDAQVNGERLSSHMGNFREGSDAYIQSDAKTVQFATQQITEAENYVQSNYGNNNNTINELAGALAKEIKLKKDNSQLIQESSNAAQVFYSNPSQVVTHAGVDHSVTAVAEAAQLGAHSADIATSEVMLDIVRKLANIQTNNAGRIDLSKYYDLSKLVHTCKERGIDLIGIISPLILSANKANDDKNQSRID